MRTLLSTLSVLFAVYSYLVYTGAPERGTVASAEVRTGMRVWQENNCAGCHQLYGLGGYMGPDLTNTYSLKGEAGIRTFVRYGTGRMPAHALTDPDLDALVAFLTWVDRSGQSAVPAEAVHWTGTYLIEPR
ncbi:MAG: cytochrome c [Flavobacteriales bacterium]|nr:cytochrome c [Flavobacteriales bacterium]